MGRPDYDDATAGDDDHEIFDVHGDTTGWLQHGQSQDEKQSRER